MSRIGRMPIKFSEKVQVTFTNGVVSVKGPLGTLSQKIVDRNIDIKIENGQIEVIRTSEIKSTRAKHGLYRQLIANMVAGVEKEFTRNLIIAGVGYKVAVNGSKLVMNIGYAKPVEYVAPEGIKLSAPDANTVTVSGISKERVGQVAATIKSKRPVEPYHGYGIHFADEVVLRKEGKTAGKK